MPDYMKRVFWGIFMPKFIQYLAQCGLGSFTSYQVKEVWAVDTPLHLQKLEFCHAIPILLN